ncbi:hypothetical protein N431DRAFT_479585 [Stipitochalara longipes BDJ]|nr:hypothetical protein N431DRAFT_479585 [Stipitochalara longipes BDJ]
MASASPPEFKLSSTQTALALIVPSQLQAEINRVRKIHDKAYRKWEPHVNILYPFVEAALLPSAIASLRAHLSSNSISPFLLKIDDVGSFEHTRSATVFLKLGEESEEQICRLRRQLVAALGRSEDEGTREGVFRPHLTMGQVSLIGPTKNRLVQKVRNLVGFEWEVERLVVLRREATGEMAVFDEISLLGEREDETESDFAGTFWRKCYHFLPNTGWKQIFGSDFDLSYSKECTRTTETTLASYNLMSDPNAPRFSNRLPHIVEAISKVMLRGKSSIRALCLQEVDEEMLPLLLAEPKIQGLFPFSTHSPSSLFPSKRNQVTMSNTPFSYYNLQFRERHKSALIISFRGPAILVANVHLTRGLTDESVAVKRDQMETLTEFLIQSQLQNERHILLAGDFNLNSSSKTLETALERGIITPQTAQSVQQVIDAEIWSDAFIVHKVENQKFDGTGLFEGEQGATFDRLKNPMALVSKIVIDNRPQRYDRVLFKKEARLEPLDFEIFGQQPKDDTCLSDHYGICATFQIKGMKATSAGTAANLQHLESIRIVEDSRDIQPFIESYLPAAADREVRKEAIDLLQHTLSQNRSLTDLILAPLGSYAMDTYFADSDLDILAIAAVTPQLFFHFATEQLRVLSSGKERTFKGIHFVNSLVSIIEADILGIKFDIQYCQAAKLVKQYHSTTPPPSLETLIFDSPIISTLSPSSLRPLNTYRSTIYLLTTLPSLNSYRIAHRFLALYLKHHGLYSAKFGYLGGIHLSLLLSRVVKLIPRSISTLLTPATIIRTFFEYYSTFDWVGDTVCDPDLEVQKGRRTERTARDAMVIQALHVPAARPNVAASCTRLSALAISSQFARAKRQLEEGEWDDCLGSREACVGEFLSDYGSYVMISVQVWDDCDVDGDEFRDVVGGVESRVVRLLVELGRIEGLEGRAWPERFCSVDAVGEQEKDLWQGWYLVGIKSREESEERKKLISRKVSTVVKDFEACLRQAGSIKEENVLISVDVMSRKKLSGLGLIVD